MKNKRISWIDYVKIIGIFFVIYGHTNISKTEIIWAYSFHMPLFFFLSGVTYGISEKRKSISLTKFVYGKIKGLLVPYVTLNFLALFSWYVSYKIYGNTKITVMDKIWGTLISNSAICKGSPTNATWFLTTLFLVLIIFFIMERVFRYQYAKITIWIVIIGAYGFIIAHKWGLSTSLPWHINVIPVAMFLFYLGFLFQRYSENVMSFIGKQRYLYAFLLIMVGSIAGVVNGKVSMHSNVYKNAMLFLISGIFITIGLIFFVWSFSGNFISEFLGGSTLIIMAVHCPILRFLENYSESTKQFVTLRPHMTTIFLFVSSIIISIVIKVFFPFLVGERYKYLKRNRNYENK